MRSETTALLSLSLSPAVVSGRPGRYRPYRVWERDKTDSLYFVESC